MVNFIHIFFDAKYRSSRCSRLEKILILSIAVASLYFISSWIAVTPAIANSKASSYCRGPLRNGLLNGTGVCNFPSGNVYKGEFRDGKKYGQGAFYYADGTRCVGEFRNDLLSGTAACVFRNGGSYEGQFVNGLRSGVGLYTFANGTRCQAEFRNDTLNGRGTCVFASGNRYEGEFQNGKQHGMGVLMMANGTRIEGLWNSGRFQQTVVRQN